jgi:hypothetical protein
VQAAASKNPDENNNRYAFFLNLKAEETTPLSA